MGGAHSARLGTRDHDHAARDRILGQIGPGLTYVRCHLRWGVYGDTSDKSDMEGVAAVGNLRNASAVFFFHRGHWMTVGKAVFNMNPNEAIAHFKNQYERVGP